MASTPQNDYIALHFPRNSFLPTLLFGFGAAVKNHQIGWGVWGQLIPIVLNLLQAFFSYFLWRIVIVDQLDLNYIPKSIVMVIKL